MDHLSDFQECARRENRGRQRRAWRYSREARRIAVAYAREHRDLGSTFASIAESLGVSPLTLSRWLEEPFEPVFHEVELPLDQPASHGLRVILPSGLVIEGLDLAQLI